MGNSLRNIEYSREVKNSQTEGSSSIYRHPKTYDGNFITDYLGADTIQKVLIDGHTKYANKNHLHTRDAKGVYQPKTYAKTFDISQKIGQGIIHLKLVEEVHEYQNFNLKFLGIFSKNKEEWTFVDMASVLYGFTTIPFYDTLGSETISFMLNHTNLITIVCDKLGLDKILKSEDLGKLRNIITFESVIEQELITKLEARNIKHYSLEQVIKAGSEGPKIEFPQIKPNDIFSFSYTSGTTGTPKGVMISHKNIMCVLGCLVVTDVNIQPTDVHISYLPLPHIYERCLFWAMTTCGASIYFYSGDILKLKQDILDVKPTIFASVPRLFNRFYDAMQNKIAEMKGLKASLVNHAIKTKLQNLRTECSYTHTLYDLLVFNKFREAFGGKIRLMITTSAPISKEVLEFLKITTCVPILEIYGQTESSGGSFVTSKYDPVCGHVGGPTTNCEFKLEDIPEMNYRSTDKDDKGNHMPRGEICIRGAGCMQGYYKSEQQTNETIDKHGWLHTGDVGTVRSNGSLLIIDRKKNIFKLSQGEYIAPEKIESVYLRTEGIAEIFVYGDSLQSHLIAIVVPSQDYVEKFAKENNITGNILELCQNEQIVKKILNNMNTQAKVGKLAGFEVVKVIQLYFQSFVIAGICTPNMKVKRNDAKIFFQQQIQDLYKIKV